MQVPDDLQLQHRPRVGPRDGDRVRIGITDYAQDALGDVVFVSLPELGSHVDARRCPRRGRVDQIGF